MPLDKDNRTHRNFSDKLDDKFCGGAKFDKVVRPVLHSTYHAARFVNGGCGNPEEWARAKDQLSKLGTGQKRTEYLEQHRALQKKQAEEKQAEEKK